MSRLRGFGSISSFSVALFLALITGCSNSSVKPPQTTPNPPAPAPPPPASFSVTAVTPASGTTGVATNATIQITFSSAADTSTVNATNIQVSAAKAVAGTVTYNASTDTATFTPSAALANGTSYTVTVSGVTSSAGTALASTFTSTFTTVAASSGGGGGGGSPTLQYQTSLLSASSTTDNGQVTVDTSGNVTVQLTGGTASTTYTARFCPAFDAGTGNTQPACTSLGSLTTNASGNGSMTVKFPTPGSWAGDFSLETSTSAPAEYATGLATNKGAPSGQVYMSTLEPASTTNGKGVVTPATPQDPLSSGSISYSNGSIQVTVKGASPNTTYTVNESETNYMDSSGTYALGSFTTDASGDGSATISVSGGAGGDLFQVVPPSGAGFIGGFSVPQ